VGLRCSKGEGGGVRMGSPSHTALSSHVFSRSHRVRMAEGVERVIKMREKRENRARTCNTERLEGGVGHCHTVPHRLTCPRVHTAFACVGSSKRRREKKENGARTREMEGALAGARLRTAPGQTASSCFRVTSMWAAR